LLPAAVIDRNGAVGEITVLTSQPESYRPFIDSAIEAVRQRETSNVLGTQKSHSAPPAWRRPGAGVKNASFMPEEKSKA